MDIPFDIERDDFLTASLLVNTLYKFFTSTVLLWVELKLFKFSPTVVKLSAPLFEAFLVVIFII
jgi:hypothetical protein